MATINLLPWRIERRVRREKAFYRMLVLVVVTSMLLALCVWFYYSSQIKRQNVRNAFLQGEISQADVQIKEVDLLAQKKDRLLERLNLIEGLLAHRAQMAHLFDALGRSIPDGVTLSSVKQNENALTLQGRSQSNAIVTTYMRSLEATGWMSKPELLTIEANRERQMGPSDEASVSSLPYVFTLTVELKNPVSVTEQRMRQSASSARQVQREPRPELAR